MNRATREARLRVLEKIAAADFERMTSGEFGQWIDDLPRIEFIALITLHDEARSK